MEDGVSAASADHLCVLVHGLWGNPNHLSYVTSALRKQFQEDQLHILVPKRNSGTFTYDGIELGGERVADEIEQTLEDLARRGQVIKKFSIMGYSLGGLVARYAIGLLYHKGWFERMEAVNFTTFASPHLGVRTPSVGVQHHLWNFLGARTLSMSGRQLFTIDHFRDTGRPLLAVLAAPDSIFIRALAKFKRRSLYANVVNDRTAVYYTTGIARTDPFVDVTSMKYNYVKGYEPVILDGENPIAEYKSESAPPNFQERLAVGTKTVLSRTPLVLFFVVFIPLGTTLYLINAAVQSVRSSQRIRLHHEGKAGIDVEGYRLPLMAEMVDGVRRTAEDIFENVNKTQSQEYLPAGSEEPTKPQSPFLSPKHKQSLSKASILEERPLLNGKEPAHENEDKSAASISKRQVEFPTLALTADQFAMIQALDDVGFKKYPVWIHNATHSHAAIIVRMQKKSFEEGKIVVKHWLSEFEI